MRPTHEMRYALGRVFSQLGKFQELQCTSLCRFQLSIGIHLHSMLIVNEIILFVQRYSLAGSDLTFKYGNLVPASYSSIKTS